MTITTCQCEGVGFIFVQYVYPGWKNYTFIQGKIEFKTNKGGTAWPVALIMCDGGMAVRAVGREQVCDHVCLLSETVVSHAISDST